MKKNKILAILLFLFLAGLAGFAVNTAGVKAYAAPGKIDAAPGAWDQVWRGSGELNDLICLNEDVCVGTGSEGLFVRTDNGGESWHFDIIAADVDLFGISFATPNRGIVVGEGGRAFWTGDGGQSWQQGQTPGTASLQSVTTADSGRAWAVGESGAIYHSSNGGDTWSQQTSNTAQTLNHVQFLDNLTGFAGGDKATLLTTTDGGSTWLPQSTGFPSWANINTLFYVDSQHGWIAGQAGLMRRTVDGGASWLPVTTGLETAAIDILDLDFSGNIGILGGITGVIATTTNGENWGILASSGANNRDVKAVYALGADNLWAGGNIKPLSDNGARAWWIQHSQDGEAFKRSAGDFGLEPHLYEVSYPDRDTAYVVGEHSAIGKTSDGGDTWSWQAVDTGTNGHRFWTVSCPDSQYCWIGGRYALLYQSDDGGISWQSQSVPGYGAPIYDIEMLDRDNGHAAGNPNMFRTSNGGDTWINSVVVGANANVDISMIAPWAGWTALRNQSYRWTTSAGQTWQRVIDPAALGAGIYVGVEVHDDDMNGDVDNAWLVGCEGPLVNEQCKAPQTGIIAYSPNNGGDWEYQTLPADTPPLMDIFMFDARSGWISGEQGALLYTESGGASWLWADNGLADDIDYIMSLDFADESHGFGVGSGGNIVRFTGPGRVLGGYQQGGDIIIDGEPNDWYQGGVMELDAGNAGAIIGDPPAPAPDDISARIFSRWLEDTLYLLVEVRDDVVIIGATDTVRIAIDGLDDGVWYGLDDHLLEIEANGTFRNTLHPDTSGAFSSGVSVTADGWVAELSIPATILQRSAFAEYDRVGLNIALDDDDGQGVEHTLILEGRQLDGNPATFAKIQLVANTLTYQNGLGAYDSAVDSYLERWWDSSGNSNHGAEPELRTIFRSGALRSEAILGFDLIGLPVGAEVLDAELDLFITAIELDGPEPDVSAYRLLRAWDEGATTWNVASLGDPWGTPGAAAPGVDLDPVPLDVVDITEAMAQQHVQWDVSEAVRAWADDPDSNHGLLLVPGAGAKQVYAYSGEHGRQDTRPQLMVSFRLRPRSGRQPAEVEGMVFDDLDGNGSHDDGEPPLSGAALHLTGADTDLWFATDADGSYQFENLQPGSFSLDEFAPPGYLPGIPPSPLSLTLSWDDALVIDFAHQPAEALFLPLVRHK